MAFDFHELIEFIWILNRSVNINKHVEETNGTKYDVYPNRAHVRPFVGELWCGIPTCNIKFEVALRLFDLIRKFVSSFK